jgi:hypothetical protein
MHILLIHQAFAALDEPGGTRHHELARFLATRGHRVTVIASPVSYLTGAPASASAAPMDEAGSQGKVNILRAYTYRALHKSFVHRFFAFVSFMVSSFFLGLRVKNVDLVWGTSPPIFQGLTAWALARLKGTKLLFEVRDLWPEFAVAVGVLKNRVLIRMAVWLERFLYRGADQVIVNSPGYVDHVQSGGPRAWRSSRTEPTRRCSTRLTRAISSGRSTSSRINSWSCMRERTACPMTWGSSWGPPAC